MYLFNDNRFLGRGQVARLEGSDIIGSDGVYDTGEFYLLNTNDAATTITQRRVHILSYNHLYSYVSIESEYKLLVNLVTVI